MEKNNIIFDYQELPIAYLANNPNSDELRKQLIRNQTGICNTSELENNFFSNDNIDIINNKLIITVFKLTKGKFKISKQSPETLLIVMRYVFLYNAKFLPYNIEGQIKELNCIVLKEILPNLITNITQKEGYLNYINKRPPLLDLPVSTNNSKTLLPYL